MSMARYESTSLRLLAATALLSLVPVTPSVAAQAQPIQAQPAVEPLQVIPLRGSMSVIVGPQSNTVVQLGDDGVIVVDTMGEADAERLLATIQSLSPHPIRYIINTTSDDDHTGGNEVLSRAGRYFSRQREAMFADSSAATIMSHEGTLQAMSALRNGQPVAPKGRWPIETFFNERQEFFVNNEGMQLIHMPAARTGGDSVIFFRRSDVLVTGDVFTPDRYPTFDMRRGGSINGYLDSLNTLLDITLPGPNEEGGTLVVPGHGRVCDESDIGEYRDMITIVRDRIQHMIGKNMTLTQIQATRPTRDYDVVYSRPGNTGEMFVERVYESLIEGQKS